MEENKDLEQDVVETDEVIDEVASDDTIVDDIIETESEIAKLEETVKSLNDKVLRQMAEFDNFRKRTLKEKQQSFNDGAVNAVEKLLPVIDNFERAMVSENDKESNFYKGVEMIYKQFLSTLDELGVKQIEAKGKEFNPNFHFAVAQEESKDVDENIVLEELQKGYIINDKVIRPAMVKVSN